MSPKIKEFFKKQKNQQSIAVIFGIIFIFWLILFSDLPSSFFEEGHQFRGEFAKFIATIVGGILIYYGLVLNAKRTKAVEEQNILTRNGQVNERFKNAIDHLGSKKPSIILGGIHAMHQIALFEPIYRPIVFNILCSYIREKTSSLPEWNDYPEAERSKIKPKIEIQTIIDLLFKSSDPLQYIYEGLSANLEGIKCIHANFNSANLKNAHLNHAHLVGANLKNVNLEGAWILYVNLFKADLTKCHMQNAIILLSHFEFAELPEATLKMTGIIGSTFKGANLKDANLEGAHLIGTNFVGSDLSNTRFIGTNLESSHFMGAILWDAHFEGSNLENADLRGADVRDAFFEGACIYQVHFEGADLREANFEGVYSKTQFTSFPDNLKSRIREKSEFKTVYGGKLDQVNANIIIEDYCKLQKIGTKIEEFKRIISLAVDTNTNISKDAIIGVLCSEKVDEILSRYNAANKNVPAIDEYRISQANLL